MKTFAPLWIGGAALAVCALAWAWSARSGRVADAAGLAPAQQTAAADARPAREDELRQLREQVAAMQAQIAASGRRDGNAAATMSPDQARRLAEQERRQHAAYLAELQSSFQLEPTDPRWSAATSARLLDSLQRDDALRGAARDIECRSSSCRVELTLDAAGSVDKQLPLWSLQLADALPRSVAQSVVRPNGERALVLYLLGPQPAAPAQAR